MITNQYTVSTVRDGALGIAFKKSAGDLGADSLGQIRNRGRRPLADTFLNRRAGGALNFSDFCGRKQKIRTIITIKYMCGCHAAQATRDRDRDVHMTHLSRNCCESAASARVVTEWP